MFARLPLFATQHQRNLKWARKVLVATSFVLLCLGFIYFAHSTSAVNRTWDGGGSTSSWSEAANWSGDVVPGSGDIAVFDGTSTKDSVIDAGFGGSLQGLQINSGYTGTITQTQGPGATLTLGSFSQSSGLSWIITNRIRKRQPRLRD